MRSKGTTENTLFLRDKRRESPPQRSFAKLVA